MKRLKETVIHHFEIKKSKFIGFLIPIANEEEAKSEIEQIKRENPKATHHCFAYRITSEQIDRFDDDGEPQHTAGKPMLSVLMAQNLDCVLAVVVRYYGGIKLGPGGLIKAYTQGVTSTIANATFIALNEVIDLSFDCPFEYAPQVEAYSYHLGAEVTSTYKESSVHFFITLNSLDSVVESLNSLTKGTITNVKHQSRYV